MIQQGGNAVDGAIAAAAVMTIVEPCSNGLGSDAFCILWDGRKLQGLNASGPAPAAWTPEYFRKKHGADAKRPPMRGWDSATVPGAVAGWVALSERFGKLPFGDLLAPAIEIAERGYAVPVIVQQKWVAAAPLARRHAGLGRGLPAARPAARSRRALRLSRGGARAEGDRGDARRCALRRRDRRSRRRALARERRRDGGERLRRLSRPSGSSRSASTPTAIACTRSRRTARASRRWSRWVSCVTSTSSRCRSTAPSRSTCRSRR